MLAEAVERMTELGRNFERQAECMAASQPDDAAKCADTAKKITLLTKADVLWLIKALRSELRELRP